MILACDGQIGRRETAALEFRGGPTQQPAGQAISGSNSQVRHRMRGVWPGAANVDVSGRVFAIGSGDRDSDDDPLNLVQADVIARTIVELRRSRGLVTGDPLSMF